MAAECWDAAGRKPAVKTEKKPRKHRNSGSVQDIIPEGTPVEVVEYRLPEEERICGVCGNEMVEIGKEVRSTLQMEPPRFWVREDWYYTYACKHCEQETGEAVIETTPMEPAVIPGSFASPSAIAHIAVQKFVMYSPLYRLEKEYERQGLKLSRQTMSNWLLSASEDWLEPIYDALHAQLLCCMSTSPREKRSTLNISCKASQDGCTGIPQTAGEHPCGGLLGACAAKI